MAYTGKVNIDKNGWKILNEILPRLKYSVSPNKLIKWLDNFEDSEIDCFLDLLLLFEFIPFDEMIYRFDDLLKSVFSNIKKGDKIYIIPFGQIGKSGTLVRYPLRKTDAFVSRKKNIKLIFDYEKQTVPKNSQLILLDDFIGSGDTFIKSYKKGIRAWAIKNNMTVYLLSTIVMNSAKKKIETVYPEVKIYGDIRNKLFNTKKSALNIFNNKDRIEELTIQYGNKIKVAGPYSDSIQPRGYKESESFLAFSYGVPNNTFPIIWGEDSWSPLYPRFRQSRMKEAKAFKKNIAFYLGMLKKLGFKDVIDETVKFKDYSGQAKQLTISPKQQFSLLLLLFLKSESYDDIGISQIIGVGEVELKEIYNVAHKKGLVDLKGSLTHAAFNYLRIIKSKRNWSDTRSTKKEDLTIKKNYYIPMRFGGVDR